MNSVSLDSGGRIRTKGMFSWAVLFSLMLHAALFLWLPGFGSGAVGVPNGSPQAEVFSLNYMGTWQDDAGAAGAKKGTQTLIAESAAPKKQEAAAASKVLPTPLSPPRQVAKSDNTSPVSTRIAAPAKTNTAQPAVLTSQRGAFSVPVEQKEKTPVAPAQPSVTENRPLDVHSKSEDAPAAQVGPPLKAAEGQGGVITGDGNGIGPLPAGESLLVAGILPAYPKNAANEGAEGTVVLQIHASKEGKISKVQLDRSSGDKRLDDVALRTVNRLWQVKPYAQPYILNVTMEFQGGSKVRYRVGAVELQDAPEA